MNYKLKNKNCIVTGASQGLGKAMAVLLAQEGCNLILVSRRPKPLKIVEKRINYKIKKKIAFALPYDVTKKDAPKKIINFCKKTTNKKNRGIEIPLARKFNLFLVSSIPYKNIKKRE